MGVDTTAQSMTREANAPRGKTGHSDAGAEPDEGAPPHGAAPSAAG